MAATSAELFAVFDRLGIEHSTVEHPPFFTVEEARPWHHRIPGLHSKNLFIKDRKGGIWLVVMPADKRADLARLEKALGAPRFSFARPDVLREVLALTPGSVTPFGLINDTRRRVHVILDEEMLESEWVNFHPLHNAASPRYAQPDCCGSSAHSATSRSLCDCLRRPRTISCAIASAAGNGCSLSVAPAMMPRPGRWRCVLPITPQLAGSRSR